MKMSMLKKAMILCGIFLALCALPKTVLASVLDSYSDGKVYDVTAYGADNTGASSSSSAVLSAVAASHKDLEKGNMDGKSRAVIYFPSGTYKLTDSFKIYSDTVIAAESDTVIQANGVAVDVIRRENTVIDGGTWSSSGSSYVIKNTESEIVVRNLSVTKGATGFLFTGGTTTMEDCSISGCTEVGFQNTRGTLTLKNVKVSGCKTGIALNSLTATVSNITVTNCTETGFKNTKGTLTLSNAAVSGGEIGYGFYSSTVKMSDCTATGCSDQAIQDTKAKLTMSSVTVSDSYTGIGIFTSTVTMNKVVVTGCTNLGMNIANKAKVTAQNITVKSNGSGYPKKNYLGHGIGVYSNATLNVSNSTISSNRECGISLSKGNAVIKKCVFESNGRHAVGTDKVCSLTMTNCTVNKNGQKDKHDGIIVVAGSKATITNCTITSSGATGLLVTDSGTKVTVKNCTFKGNKTQNIYIENLGSGKATVTVNGGKFYKTKSSYSIRVHVNSTSQYSLTLKGSIKYYSVKKGYTLWMGNENVHKTK